MQERGRLERLHTAIRDYAARVEKDPDQKCHPIFPEASVTGAPPNELSPTERDSHHLLELSTDADPFLLYAIAKAVFTSKAASAIIEISFSVIPQWLRACAMIGAYEECVTFSERVIGSTAWSSLSTDANEGIAVINTSAKCLRNLGEFSRAFERYRQGITFARTRHLQVQVDYAIMMIAKQYGNFLGQYGACYSLLLDVLTRFEATSYRSDSDLVGRYRAICHDAIGQASRDLSWRDAQKHFLSAIRINKRIGRENGMGRAICHLSFALFQKAKPSRRRNYLKQFESALENLLRDDTEERGLGIRFVQLAWMIAKVDNIEAAETFLDEGKRVATKYSDYRTLCRSALFEAAMFSDADPERAIKALELGAQTAERCHLLLLESELNRKLAELGSRFGGVTTSPARLFERNREIFTRLMIEVKESLSTIISNDAFADLTGATRQLVRERLLGDFENIARGMNENLFSVTEMLQRTERRRQELLVLGVVNSVARELLHEVKLAIPEGGDTSPLQVVAGNLRHIASQIAKVTSSQETGDQPIITRIGLNLEDQAQRLGAIADQLRNLKGLLANRLRRPRALDEWVSVAGACADAIAEADKLRPGTSKRIIFAIGNTDIYVMSDRELITTVIINLVMNAAEAHGTIGRITVALQARAIGRSGNPSRVGILEVRSRFESQEDARAAFKAIEASMAGQATTKPFGSGVGMDLLCIVFGDLLRGGIAPLCREKEAGIEIRFRPGSGHVILVGKDEVESQ